MKGFALTHSLGLGIGLLVLSLAGILVALASVLPSPLLIVSSLVAVSPRELSLLVATISLAELPISGLVATISLLVGPSLLVSTLSLPISLKRPLLGLIIAGAIASELALLLVVLSPGVAASISRVSVLRPLSHSQSAIAIAGSVHSKSTVPSPSLELFIVPMPLLLRLRLILEEPPILIRRSG